MSPEQVVRAFAPATVANVACGFDILGFALERPGDEVVARRTEQPGVVLTEITGDGGRLPLDASLNTAGRAVQALLDRLEPDCGVALKLHKGLPLASGLGSSAASAVAAVFAVDQLLEAHLPLTDLLLCALEGERLASGSAHADNAAPSLYGGFVLVRSSDPPDVVRLPIPEGLSCAVVRPHIEVETATARALLGEWVRLRDAVTQWGNVAGLMVGLLTEDWDLIRRSLEDVIAEPVRAAQVPGFSAAQRSALESGALGCSLSGSGPSIFALCRDRATAEAVGRQMSTALQREAGLSADRYVSEVSPTGARLLEEGESACAS